jgi:acyl-CoA synthetase (AMP-forming)/AMP-acid ligase II
MRAGFIPFPISLRNSAAAVTNLLVKTNCRYWYVSDDIATQKLAGTAIGQLDSHQIKNLEVPTLSELLSALDEDLLPPLGNVGLDEPCIIQHSSGSTSLPKPITITQRMVLPYGYGPCK